MPRGGGADPLGQGFGVGRGRGMGVRRGRTSGGGLGAGRGGNCICTSCGNKVMHQPGIPCSSMSCPKCGMRMVRE